MHRALALLEPSRSANCIEAGASTSASQAGVSAGGLRKMSFSTPRCQTEGLAMRVFGETPFRGGRRLMAADETQLPSIPLRTPQAEVLTSIAAGYRSPSPAHFRGTRAAESGIAGARRSRVLTRMGPYAESSFLVSCHVVDANIPRASAWLSVAPLAFIALAELEFRNAFNLNGRSGRIACRL